MLMLVHTNQRRYAVDRGDVTELRVINGLDGLAALGTPDRSSVPVDLGAWFDPRDVITTTHWHAMVVPVRRRPIVFLTERIESMIDRQALQPLPALISRRLQEPWVRGVIELEDGLVIAIDLRAVARSILAQRPAKE
jgi:chemotaxis signal transduction protein